MDQSLRILVHLKVKGGAQEAFRRIATEITAGAEAAEPRTHAYEWYLSEDGADGYLFERYPDSEALLLHLANVGPKLVPLLEITTVEELMVLGSPSEQLREALSRFEPSFAARFTGFAR